jgi:hypothetical protein
VRRLRQRRRRVEGYPPKFPFAGGRIVKVVFDVADDVYVDVERKFAAVTARD